jgi:hypothetical protein
LNINLATTPVQATQHCKAHEANVWRRRIRLDIDQITMM